MAQEERRVEAVMGLVMLHHLEHRVWNARWGAVPKPAVGGLPSGWRMFDLKDHPKPDSPVLRHPQLRMSVGNSLSGADTTIMRWRADGRRAFEARDVFVVSLPELLLTLGRQRTAAEIYDMWVEAEVIIGKRRHASR